MINPKELFGKDYSEFSEVDPFNPQNEVSGYISRKPTELYGALIITKVNGEDVTPQLIYATPKMHYPFGVSDDGVRHYNFPVAKSIEIYEKLDGTNILSFFYNDGDTRFLSYKTRLRPFLSSGKFGNFLDMWREVASSYFVEIEREMHRSGCNLSFELFGSRNPHLVIYSNPLSFALLFGVTENGNILSPTRLRNPDLPVVNKIGIIDRDFTTQYEALQKDLESKLVKLEDEYYQGMEGAVWYLHAIDGRTIQLKCKPETIETIHFSAGASGLSRNIIVATCWNAFENTDKITIELVKQLLSEEFDQAVIEAHHYLIERCMAEVTEQAEFRGKVLAEYNALGMNIVLNKSEVMRALSEKFPKNMMKKVYSVIVGNG